MIKKMVIFFTGMFLYFNSSPCYSGWCCFGPDDDEEEEKVRLLSTQRAMVRQSQQSEETERKERERKIIEERLKQEEEKKRLEQERLERDRKEEARQQQEKTKKEEADRLRREEESKARLQQEQQREEDARQQREREELELQRLQKKHEEEKRKLDAIKQQREEEALRLEIERLQKQQEEERIEKERLEQERANLSNSSALVSLPFNKKEEGEDYELITYANISLLLPKGLEIVLGKKEGTQQEDGTLIAILPQVCQMQIFPDIETVTPENRELRQLRGDSQKARPPSKEVLKSQMSWVYKDMRGKKDQVSIDFINSMIACLQKVVEKIPEQGLIPVLMHRNHETKLSRILFEMKEGGGVLLLVPNRYTKQREEQ